MFWWKTFNNLAFALGLASVVKVFYAQKFVGIAPPFRARTFESENLRFEARGVKPRLLSRG
ncbi:hypothetical protein AUJ69_00695 [Candidatus Woesearchaeota archaeon CG1_02_47_18]|nr:MAG: hypothetical protein AUJ69_00695 [Candidatus Woesearchaeota archaeon CG1_02_47_18]